MPIDVSDNWITIRIADAAAFQKDSFRVVWISQKDGIKARIGKKKGKTKTETQAFLFDKKKWTVSRAKKWVKDHGYTILGSERSAHVDKQYRIGGEFKAAEPKSNDAILSISGYASTNDVDSYNEIVEPTAFNHTMAEYEKFPIVLFGHHWSDKPIGKTTSWNIDERGLFVDIDIMNTAEGRDIKTLIDAGVLKALSIGFQSLGREEPEEEGDPAKITKLRLYEISVVNVPANQQAVFESAKACNLELKALTTEDNSTRRVAIMAAKSADLKEVQKQIEEMETALDTVSGDVQNLNETIEKQHKLINEVKEKSENEKDGLMSKPEFKTFSEKIGQDLIDLQKSVQKVAAAKKIESAKLPYLSWKMARDIPVIFNDNGKPLSDRDQMAYKLFQVPVKYEGEEGRLLKEARDLNDIVVMVDAAYRARGRRYNITDLKSYQLLREYVEEINPEFAKAMYSTGTGVGDEWVPTLMSSEMYDLYRLEAKIESLIPSFDMPSNPFTWPIKTSNPSLYLASEAAVANPDTLLTSDLGTSNVTFTAGIFATAMVCSPELIEDTIVYDDIDEGWLRINADQWR